MEKKETYKAPEMRSVVLIKEGVMTNSLEGYHRGGGGQYDDDTTNENGDY